MYTCKINSINATTNLLSGQILVIPPDIAQTRVYIYRNGQFLIVAAPLNDGSFSYTLPLLNEGDSFYCRVKYQFEFSEYSPYFLFTISRTDTFFNKSYHSQFYKGDESDINEWILNVLDKLKHGGLVPQYILENITTDWDKFWKGILAFFAIYFKTAEAINSGLLNDSFALISKHLSSRGVFYNKNQSINDLKALRENFFNIMLQRSSLNGNEIETLLNVDASDLVIKKLHNSKTLGWNIGNSSPNYRSGDRELKILSDLETTGNPTENNGIITVNGTGSLGRNFGEYFCQKKMKVSDLLDYEISFYVRKTYANTFLQLSVHFFDESGHKLGRPKSLVDGTDNEYFYEEYQFNQTNEWVFIKVILYNSSKGLNPGDTLNLKQPFNVKYLSLNVVAGDADQSELEVKEISIKPIHLFSKGFLQTNHLFQISTENNYSFSVEDLEEMIGRYLLPYQCHLFVNLLVNNSDIDKFPCSNYSESNYIVTGNTKCEKVNGLNTGKVLIEKTDINSCTQSRNIWEDGEFNFNQCPKCLGTGVEIFFDTIDCYPLSIDFDFISCESTGNVDFDFVSCCKKVKTKVQSFSLSCNKGSFVKSLEIVC